MTWQQLILQINHLHAEEIGDWLSEHGAQAVTLEDAKDNPILEPAPGETPLWDQINLTALFEENDAVAEILKQLKKHFEESIQTAKITLLEDQQWERAWMVNFKAMRFGKRLWICPSWETIPAPDAVNIILDPGLAFGSGTHETTALCLEYLDAEDLHSKTVLDYGCGSGILAIAAAKLGASHIIGADNDPQAIIASRENAVRNKIDNEKISFIQVSAKSPPAIEAVDILVANILAEPLRLLAEDLVEKVKSGGQVALSGLLIEQAEEIMAIYQRWFTLNPVKKLGSWCLVSGVKK